MRLTRAYVASAGTGFSIVAAAVAALFVLSASVALQGWPGIDPDNDVPRLTLSEALPAAGTPAAAAAAAAAPVAPAPVVLDGPAPGGAADTAPAGTDAAPAPADADGAPAADGPAPGDAAAPAPADTPPAPADPAPTAGGAGSLGDVVRSTGGTVGAAVTPAAPQAGPVVEGAADAVAGPVDGVTAEPRIEGAVGALLGG